MLLSKYNRAAGSLRGKARLKLDYSHQKCLSHQAFLTSEASYFS